MSVFSKLFRNNQPEQVVKKRSATEPVIRVVGQGAVQTITEPNEAMKSSVVYRCMAILSDAVASCPIDIYRADKQGYWREDDRHPLHSLLTRRPNSRQNYYEFLENIVMHLIAFGNAYIYIKETAALEPVELILLAPKSTFYNQIDDNYVVNDVYNKINGTFNSRRIIHIKHKSLKAYLGQPVFDFSGRAIALAKAADVEALKTLGNGGKLRGIVASESSLTGFGSAIDDQVDTIRDNMVNQLNSGDDIITLQSGAKFTPISQTMADLQITDLKDVSLTDICRYFGVSPVKAGISQGATNYRASEADTQNFSDDTVQPILCKIEAAFNSKLLTLSQSKRYKIAFDRKQSQYFPHYLTRYGKLMDIGAVSVNDVRKILLLPPVAGGEAVLVSTNTQPLTNPTVDAVDTDPADEEINNDENNTQE